MLYMYICVATILHAKPMQTKIYKRITHYVFLRWEAYRHLKQFTAFIIKNNSKE